MTKRRGRGEGSIYRRKDGSWVAQYTVGDKRRYIYGKTRKDVAAKLSKAIADRDSGLVYDSENLKVVDYLDKWLDAIRDTLRGRRWQRHEQVTRIHLKPAIRSTKLDGFNALLVQSLHRSKLAEGISPAGRGSSGRCIYKALKWAVKWFLLPRNVCDAVDRSRPQEGQRPPEKINEGALEGEEITGVGWEKGDWEIVLQVLKRVRGQDRTASG
jgi:integrase